MEHDGAIAARPVVAGGSPAAFIKGILRADRATCGISILAGFLAVFTALALLPGRADIPPLVQSDYCYLLMAAERFNDGLGLTSLQPVAPHQPWTWAYDWAFLTKWPIGYPLLVSAVRAVTGAGTLAACKWLNVLACSLALTAWFLWIRRCVPRGVTGTLLSAVAAGCSLPLAMLINPSTDVVLIALLPVAMLLTARAVETASDPAAPGAMAKRSAAMTTPSQRSMPAPSAWAWHPVGSAARLLKQDSSSALALAGIIAGGLFWIRYASVFVPFAIAAYLTFEWRRNAAVRTRNHHESNGTRDETSSRAAPVRKRADFRNVPSRFGVERAVSGRHVMIFAACAAVPIVTLLALNSALGAGPVQDQLNLGTGVRLNLSFDLLSRTWWNFTDLGFYSHHGFSHWVFATLPIVLVAAVAASRPARRRLAAFAADPPVCLSLVVAASMLGMLIVATALFGEKFDYVGLERYYFPARPLYFALFVAPLALMPRRAVRVTMCVGLLVACSWLVRQEWGRPYGRWMAAGRPSTAYGQWSRCFEPGAGDLYNWLRAQAGPDLIVLSNFHEYVALETGIPALPIPQDVDALNDWMDRIRESRAASDVRVLFVLDPSNKWRDYWIPAPAATVRRFNLQPCAAAPAAIAPYLFEYASG